MEEQGTEEEEGEKKEVDLFDSLDRMLLSKIPHDQSILYAETYTELRREISSYLKSFAEKNQVITPQVSHPKNKKHLYLINLFLFIGYFSVF